MTTAFENVLQIRQVAQPIIDMLDDTMLLCGSEAYVSVLAFYTYLKGAAKMNVPGAKTILEDLSTRFPGRPAKKKKWFSSRTPEALFRGFLVRHSWRIT